MPDWLVLTLALGGGAVLGLALGGFVTWRVSRKIKRIADL
jgi:hypothetical protein